MTAFPTSSCSLALFSSSYTQQPVVKSHVAWRGRSKPGLFGHLQGRQGLQDAVFVWADEFFGDRTVKICEDHGYGQIWHKSFRNSNSFSGKGDPEISWDLLSPRIFETKHSHVTRSVDIDAWRARTSKCYAVLGEYPEHSGNMNTVGDEFLWYVMYFGDLSGNIQPDLLEPGDPWAKSRQYLSITTCHHQGFQFAAYPVAASLSSFTLPCAHAGDIWVVIDPLSKGATVWELCFSVLAHMSSTPLPSLLPF